MVRTYSLWVEGENNCVKNVGRQISKDYLGDIGVNEMIILSDLKEIRCIDLD